MELLPVRKVKVGIVGEIYAKYSPLANNHLEEFLRSQDCEVNVPGLMGFMLFKVDNRLDDIQLYGGNPLKKFVVQALFNYLRVFETYTLDAVAASKRYHKPASYLEVKEMVRPLVGYGCKMGEGWFLTGEMIELIQSGYGEHRLRPALRLPAQPHRRQGQDPPDPRDVSPGQHRPHRLRLRRHARQPGEPHQAHALVAREHLHDA